MEMRSIIHPDHVAYLRDDFYTTHQKLIDEILRCSGGDVFCHTLSRMQGDQRVSSEFLNHPEWQQTYWSDFYNKNPLSKPLAIAAKREGVVLVTCDALDPDSDCMEKRRSMTNTVQSLALVIHHSDDTLENIAFGFKKRILDSINFDILNKVQKLLIPLREEHMQVLQTHSIKGEINEYY